MSIYKNGQKVLGSIVAIDDNHIKEVANADRNIKTYTTLESLGLSSGCSVEDIFSALPDNSYCEIGCSSSAGSGLYVVTNVPTETSSTYGLLSIRKLNKTRFSLEYKFSGGGILLPNTLYIGTLKGNDASGLTWDKVCTTTIEDVSTTPVATQNLGEGYVSYNIINGICTIALNSIKVTSNALQYITTEAINLPAQSINNSWYQIFSTSGDVGFVRVVDGKIQTFNNFDTTKNYHGTFSYKVAEI